jgi:hypothetical protein
VGEGYWPMSFERAYDKDKNVKEKGKRRKIKGKSIVYLEHINTEINEVINNKL